MIDPVDPGTTPDPHAPPTPDLTVGFVPGVMPQKWFTRWHERGLSPELRSEPLADADWHTALDTGRVTACLVRLGWADTAPSLTNLRETHHAIELYAERQVVVLDREHVLTLLDTITDTDLADEGITPRRPAIDDARAALELTAAGLDPVILPMSVARLHARKDLTFRELTDAPEIPVILTWPRGLNASTEAAVQRFVGIVRGRRASTTRDDDAAAPRSSRPTGSARDTDRPGRSRSPRTARSATAPRTKGGRGGGRKNAASSTETSRRRRNRPSR